MITPELLTLSKWVLGPEDAMQIDVLPNLPLSGGYKNILITIDVFSRDLFAYPLTEASAINVAKVLIDLITKLAYLPTTLITDKGTAFTSTIIESEKLLIDKTKQNVMQLFIKYKEYYDHKSKVAPLKENEYCFVLQRIIKDRKFH